MTFWGTFAAGWGICIVFAMSLGMPLAEAAAVSTMGTRSGRAEIGTDQATGDAIIRTPDARPVKEYTGPDTIIVRPEMYPDRSGSASGSRPQEPALRRP